ncbi:MAG: NAD(P)-binding domain-containing protein [Pseudomonadota bacterium]
MQIGIAGCGRMGAPMLENLNRSGFQAIGYDIRPAADFAGLNAVVTQDKSAFAIDCEVLMIVVRDDTQTEEVLFSSQGFSRAPNLEAIIICSTLPADYVDDLRARIPANISLIDAPMSGATVSAKNASLSFMLGGSDEAIGRYRSIFEALGQQLFHCGAFGQGMRVKLLNNLIATSSVAMTRLVHDWAAEMNLDWDALRDVLDASSGQNWFANGFDEIEFARAGYAERNSLGILRKDVEAALASLPEDERTVLPKTLIDVIKGLKQI